jgi:hypothetical protein
MVYFADYREQTVSALETVTFINAQGADTPGNFVVPANASRITEIIIGLAPEATVDNIMGAGSVIHIHGGGVKLPLGFFAGPSFTAGGGAATTGGSGFEAPMRYMTNIPVQPGEFRADGFMIGEDVGAIHLTVGIVYDGVPGRIIDGDVRSLDLTTTNALTTLTERADATVEGDMKPPYSTIGEIFLCAGAKVTAGNDAITIAYHLTGEGLVHAGNYKWVAATIAIADDTAVSLNAKNFNPMRYVCGAGIQVKRNTAIRWQGVMLEGDVGTAWGQVGVGYY